jgi:ABC-2 type transport system permease protein
MFKELFRIFDYREMLKNSVRKELRVRYKGSVLGFLWTFINPLMQLVIYSFVFEYIMGVKAPPGVNYPLMIFVGLVPWTCFSATLNQSTMAIIGNGNLIKKIYFPRLILPLSMTLTNFINMLLTGIIVFAAVLILQAPITWSYALLPVVYLALFLLTFAFSVLLAALTVYFRDLEHILSILTMIWFYLTPIIYSIDTIETNKYMNDVLLTIYKMNPLFGIIDSFRKIMIEGKLPSPLYLGYVFAFAIILLLIALAVFDKCQKRFAEEI